MAPLLYDPIEAFELLIAIIIFHTTRRLHFLILQISGLNLIASGHYDFVNVCIILLSRIEKIHREAAEKMLFLRSKKTWKSAFFRAIFLVSMVSIWGWYQCESMTGWLVGKNGDREHKHWYALPDDTHWRHWCHTILKILELWVPKCSGKSPNTI